MYYKLTVLGQKETIRFPLRAIPFLNQTMETVKFRTLMDPVDSRWLLLIKTVKKIVKSWQQSMMKLLGSQPFDTFTQYQGLYLSHKQLVEVGDFVGNLLVLERTSEPIAQPIQPGANRKNPIN